ncbi:MAG: 4-hydroxythreonine-4-phosphate dehydrogenase PdxA [Candidatus Omnitrophica bacterium]|nr:4-hydroxythreonine-4-phosphate dehydrogenase PdxA [Candidatus Omnitrophota bacterium]MDD5661970.1 4-hydroxythreonine-4-phosphate dehydrogenase PdxA [Candidatus Omnitrophota bacterium]
MKLKRNPISKSNRVRVGLTIGDPSGIGPVITLKALRELKKAQADFVVIGDAGVLKKIPGASIVDMNNLNLRDFSVGQIKAEYGRASVEYLDKALELLKDKKIDCLVTAPISKEAINKAGLRYGGHTEYFWKKTRAKEVVMLLLNNKLKFSLVTRHIPIGKVPGELTKEKLYTSILITYKSLKYLFGIKKPRLVVCGLNPHASDNGVIGTEENRVIKPVLKKLKDKIKLDIDGPLAADVAVYRAETGNYDCVIAMYHDQALIPLKLTGRDSGVNMTLGLPFIRTSPLHGTAFDIAQTPALADPASMIAAIKLAIKCASNLKKA